MDEITDIVNNIPWFGDLVMLMGMARLIFKPMFSMIEAVITATPSKSDDLVWEKIKGSKCMSGALWFMDYIASIKISVKKKDT